MAYLQIYLFVLLDMDGERQFVDRVTLIRQFLAGIRARTGGGSFRFRIPGWREEDSAECEARLTGYLCPRGEPGYEERRFSV